MMTHAAVVEPPLKRILFCTDFSANADLAFTFALAAAIRHAGSTLYLLHVIPEPDAQFWKTYVYEVDDIDAKAKRDIDTKIQTSYLSRVPDGVAIRIDIRIGRDAAVILEVAEQQGIDLIVMGRQGRSAFGKMLFGNVTEKVSRHANCPILIIPGSARLAPTDAAPHT